MDFILMKSTKKVGNYGGNGNGATKLDNEIHQN